MIHVVTANNRHLYRAQLSEMHQLRRVHFVEERGWKDMTVIDGGEYDQFDDERCVYVLALDVQAKVMGGMRTRPTDDKCMLTDIFPDLIGPDQPPMCGPDVWELSRIFTTRAGRQIRKTTGRTITLDIGLAAMEWLYGAGIERVVGVLDLAAFPGSRAKGWNLRMVGLPIDTPTGPIIGIEIANTEADLDAFRRMNDFEGRAGHVVTDEDIAAFGSLEGIEAEFAVLHQEAPAVSGQSHRPT